MAGSAGPPVGHPVAGEARAEQVGGEHELQEVPEGGDVLGPRLDRHRPRRPHRLQQLRLRVVHRHRDLRVPERLRHVWTALHPTGLLKKYLVNICKNIFSWKH